VVSEAFYRSPLTTAADKAQKAGLYAIGEAGSKQSTGCYGGYSQCGQYCESTRIVFKDIGNIVHCSASLPRSVWKTGFDDIIAEPGRHMSNCTLEMPQEHAG
jgi:hypothetical protein